MISKFLTKQFYINLSIVVLIFFIDRFSKIYVLIKDEKNLEPDLFSSTFLNISLIWNSGIAFGFLSFKEKYLYNAITVLICLVILVIAFIVTKTLNFRKYSYLMVLGGALGNLYDRIVYMSVPDFIDIHYNGFHWFIFNIADIFITLGVICLIYDEIFIQKKTNVENI